MKKKNVSVVVILMIAIILIVGISVLAIRSRMSRTNDAENFTLKKAELEETFKASHGSTTTDDMEIIRVEDKSNVMFIGYYPTEAVAQYTCYSKGLIGNHWKLQDSGNLTQQYPNGMVETYNGEYVYVSLNQDAITSVTVKNGNKSEEVATDANKPMAVIVKNSSADLTFTTQDGAKISLEQFKEGIPNMD